MQYGGVHNTSPPLRALSEPFTGRPFSFLSLFLSLSQSNLSEVDQERHPFSLSEAKAAYSVSPLLHDGLVFVEERLFALSEQFK